MQGIDADHSGTITVDELKAGMKKAGSPVAMAELQALLSQIDVDANGMPSASWRTQQHWFTHSFTCVCVLTQAVLVCKWF